VRWRERACTVDLAVQSLEPGEASPDWGRRFRARASVQKSARCAWASKSSAVTSASATTMTLSSGELENQPVPTALLPSVPCRATESATT